jgi:hypothetical protein
LPLLCAFFIAHKSFPLYGRNALIIPSVHPEMILFPSCIISTQLLIAYSNSLDCANSILSNGFKVTLDHNYISSLVQQAKIDA